MPPPRELPGFYFDPEKNRYFPVRGPIPGSKRASSSSSSSSSSSGPSTSSADQSSRTGKKHHILKACGKKQVKAPELLRARELHGKPIVSKNCRYNFEYEYQKLQASHPMVWKHSHTTHVAVSALQDLYGIVQTPNGLMEANLLTTGSRNGSICLYEVGNIGEHSICEFKSVPQCVWGAEHDATHESIWSSSRACTSYPSSISCIQRIGKQSPGSSNDGALGQNTLVVTTLGSELSGGSVYILNLSDPLDFSLDSPGLHSRSSRIGTSNCTIWTADCNYNGTQAVIGTNMGAALVNLETGVLSWVYQTKSDIFSQQFDPTGNIVLCGLRSGAIVPVDIRQKQSRYSAFSAELPASTTLDVCAPSRAPRSMLSKRSSEQMFKFKRNLAASGAVFMSSAVCSLIKLTSDDQYFLGSSMDGSIKLFDQRLLQRGAIQSYEGHVNSHTHLQLGVNLPETLVISGGEDCFVRIWSIKNGELIFEENVSNSVQTTICWPRSIQDSYVKRGLLTKSTNFSYDFLHSWEVWMGSHDGLFYMHGT